jgi:orotate phosphoribosyltransferase
VRPTRREKMDIGKEIAKRLLQINAITVRSASQLDKLFTWASGIKSPIYCDNRLTMSYPEIREMIAEGFVDMIRKYYSQVEVIVGTATAGIPHAAWTAQKMNLPMAYVRSSAKDHGKKNQIEGIVRKAQKAVVIEDLISTGGSSIKTVKALREVGVEVLGVAGIFTYGFRKADEVFDNEGVSCHTLTNYDTLLSVAVDMGYLKEEEKSVLRKWSQDPYMFTNE